MRVIAPLLICASLLVAAPPAPKEHFGFTPGDDYKLADYTQISGYFKRLAATSERIRLEKVGGSSEGRDLLVAFISSEANLRQLPRWKEINRKLALGQATAEEAHKLAVEGKAIVWIDSGLHATEVAPVQHAPHLAYRMLTDESEEVRRIRENVILMQVPVINPDGLDMVAHWYAKNVGTPHELAPLPRLYQKYAGHDNNRDWFMLNLEETRHISRVLYREWFPHIVYNQHQVAPFPARIFIPPYAEPLNPNIPAPVIGGINVLGGVMRERFARENKPGAISYVGFDAWWNGGLRSVPAFHNMHGILTETAGFHYATPGDYKHSELPDRFASGLPTKEPSVFYDRPWMGGRWALMDAIQYMLTADLAILDHAARQPGTYLLKAWEMARANIDAPNNGGPFAYIVPAGQWDSWSAVEMLRRLQGAGIEVRRATQEFTASHQKYPAGSYVLMAAQPFRAYLVDLMEVQRYPEIRAGQAGPTKRPYDIAGWTLPFQMGVKVDRVNEPFAFQGGVISDLLPAKASLGVKETGSFIAAAEQLARGARVRRSGKGDFLVEGISTTADWDAAKWELSKPRVGLYEPWSTNMDTGWTQWLLDTFKVPHTLLHNSDIRRGALNAKLDVVILASQSLPGILHGVREGEKGARDADLARKSQQRAEYAGGIGAEGVRMLEEFVRNGGTLLAFDAATELPLEMFPLGVRGVVRSTPGENSGWYCPGSLLRVTIDPSNPLAYGMQSEGIATVVGGQAFDITLLDEANRGDRETRGVVWYAKEKLLASGWVSGERVVTGRAAMIDARMGQGRVVLFGFRPQFRGQSFGTFKLVLNAIYQSSAKPVSR